MSTTQADIWTFRDPNVRAGMDFTGYKVEAIDGSIGKVDDATNEVGTGALIVDAGPWIFGKKVMLPAGVVDRIDTIEEKLYVHRTKDEIKNAPEFNDSSFSTDSYRSGLGDYYGPTGSGWRPF